MSSRKESPRLTAGDVLARYNDGSWPDFCDTLTDVNQVGTFGNRPIHFACYHGNMEEIKALVEGGPMSTWRVIWDLHRCTRQLNKAILKQLGFGLNTERALT